MTVIGCNPCSTVSATVTQFLPLRFAARPALIKTTRKYWSLLLEVPDVGQCVVFGSAEEHVKIAASGLLYSRLGSLHS